MIKVTTFHVDELISESQECKDDDALIAQLVSEGYVERVGIDPTDSSAWAFGAHAVAEAVANDCDEIIFVDCEDSVLVFTKCKPLV